MPVTVNELYEKPFLKRTYEEKVQIATQNKPRPPLDFGQNDKSQSVFDTTLYDRIKWLTGCEKRQQLYCWPCLLFRTRKWYLRTSNVILMTCIKHHEEDSEHLEAVLKLQVFRMKNVQKPNVVVNKIEHNNTVKRNIDILKRLIDAVCFVIEGQFERSDKYECNLLEISSCVKALQIMEHCDKSNADVIDDAIGLLDKSPRVLNELVDAMTLILKVAVVNEIKHSSYVSVILSEHVINDQISQISTVLRYTKNEKVYERFVGFTNVAECKSQHVGNHIMNIVKGYGLAEKFLALSFDGAVLPKDELSLLLSHLRSKYFFSYVLVPCHFHGFGRVLIQSLSRLEECSMFFKTVTAIESFFEDETHFNNFEAKLFYKHPHLRTNKWYTTSPFIMILGIYRELFIHYFHNQLMTARFLSPDDTVKVKAFKTYLQSFNAIFLLKAFCKIFSDHFDKYFNFYIESSENIFAIFINDKVGKFRSNICRLLSNGFDEIWIDVTIDDQVPKDLKEMTSNNYVKMDYANLFQKILNNLLEELNFRCKDFRRLVFCDLFYGLNHMTPSNNNLEAYFKYLTNDLPSHFDLTTLRSELIIVKEELSVFTDKSVHELLEIFEKNDLTDVFPQLYKLSKLVLTLPFLPPSSENTKLNKLQCINNHFYMPKGTGIPSGEISVLSIEKLMLRDLRGSQKFMNDVIAKFSKLNDMALVQV